MHNDLGITSPVLAKATPFHDRPFPVIHGDVIAGSIWRTIEDTEVKALPFGVGKIEQCIDSTDILSHVGRSRALSALY
jgi:hypothetical protein